MPWDFVGPTDSVLALMVCSMVVSLEVSAVIFESLAKTVERAPDSTVILALSLCLMVEVLVAVEMVDWPPGPAETY